MSAPFRLTIVVPVHNAATVLASSLAAIRASELASDDYELIVVDDASTDGSDAVAAQFADTLVRLRGLRSGPAYARNRGAELARGSVVAFVDADVVVRPDTFSTMLSALDETPTLGAISASY